MQIYCDVNGTITNGERLHAVQRMAASGHSVAFCSGFPEGARELVGGAEVLDKVALQRERPTGALIDDDPLILSIWARRGGIAVPAERLLEFAAAVTRP